MELWQTKASAWGLASVVYDPPNEKKKHVFFKKNKKKRVFEKKQKNVFYLGFQKNQKNCPAFGASGCFSNHNQKSHQTPEEGSFLGFLEKMETKTEFGTCVILLGCQHMILQHTWTCKQKSEGSGTLHASCLLQCIIINV